MLGASGNSPGKYYRPQAFDQTGAGLTTNTFNRVIFSMIGSRDVGGTTTSGAVLSAASQEFYDFMSDTNTLFRFTGDTTGDIYNGKMCQVSYWAGALTQAGIQSVMEKTYEELTASEKTNLVSYYPLDTVSNLAAGSGNVKDSHGSNHGTLA